MTWPFSRKQPPRQSGKVLLLLDWDNIVYGLLERFGLQGMDLEVRIKKLNNWVLSEIGTPLDGFGFVFAPEHLNAIHQAICVRNNMRLITCPKKEAQIGSKPEDTVDATLMWFSDLMLKHQEVQFVCLVSGDEDYEPMVKGVKKAGVKMALVTPALRSLSNQGGLSRFADNHPVTGKKMFISLDTL